MSDEQQASVASEDAAAVEEVLTYNAQSESNSSRSSASLPRSATSDSLVLWSQAASLQLTTASASAAVWPLEHGATRTCPGPPRFLAIVAPFQPVLQCTDVATILSRYQYYMPDCQLLPPVDPAISSYPASYEPDALATAALQSGAVVSRLELPSARAGSYSVPLVPRALHAAASSNWLPPYPPVTGTTAIEAWLHSAQGIKSLCATAASADQGLRTSQVSPVDQVNLLRAPAWGSPHSAGSSVTVQSTAATLYGQRPRSLQAPVTNIEAQLRFSHSKLRAAKAAAAMLEHKKEQQRSEQRGRDQHHTISNSNVQHNLSLGYVHQGGMVAQNGRVASASSPSTYMQQGGFTADALRPAHAAVGLRGHHTTAAAAAEQQPALPGFYDMRPAAAAHAQAQQLQAELLQAHPVFGAASSARQRTQYSGGDSSRSSSSPAPAPAQQHRRRTAAHSSALAATGALGTAGLLRERDELQAELTQLRSFRGNRMQQLEQEVTRTRDAARRVELVLDQQCAAIDSFLKWPCSSTVWTQQQWCSFAELNCSLWLPTSTQHYTGATEIARQRSKHFFRGATTAATGSTTASTAATASTSVDNKETTTAATAAIAAAVVEGGNERHDSTDCEATQLQFRIDRRHMYTRCSSDDSSSNSGRSSSSSRSSSNPSYSCAPFQCTRLTTQMGCVLGVAMFTSTTDTVLSVERLSSIHLLYDACSMAALLDADT
jgi:hypothetical protein